MYYVLVNEFNRVTVKFQKIPHLDGGALDRIVAGMSIKIFYAHY